jgi:hypothetical protein
LTRSPSSATRRVFTRFSRTTSLANLTTTFIIFTTNNGISNTACLYHRRQPRHRSRNCAGFRKTKLSLHISLPLEREPRIRGLKPHTSRLSSTTPIHLRLHHIVRILEHHKLQRAWPSQRGRLLKDRRPRELRGDNAIPSVHHHARRRHPRRRRHKPYSVDARHAILAAEQVPKLNNEVTCRGWISVHAVDYQCVESAGCKRWPWCCGVCGEQGRGYGLHESAGRRVCAAWRESECDCTWICGE